jgi:hypothetical protein
MQNYLKQFLSSETYKFLNNISDSQKQKIYREINNDNFHSLNNFLSLSGFYGEQERLNYIQIFNDQKTKNFKTVLICSEDSVGNRVGLCANATL